MKKILYMLACDIAYTGTPIYVRDIINETMDEYESYVFTPGYTKQNVFSNKVEIYEGKLDLTKKINFIHNIKMELKQLDNQVFDVVYINTSNVHLAYTYVHYFSKRKEKIICHSHNVITYNKGVLYDTLIKIKKNNIVRQADMLFACSKEAGESMFGTKADYSVINNFIETEKFVYDEKSRTELRRILNIKEEILLGHVGAFNKQKNQIFLLNMMKNMDKKYGLVLIGDGPNKEACLEFVKNNSLDNVYFISPIKDVHKYYSLFDIFVFPSLFEGFGRVIVEAVASNLNILTARGIPASEIFGINQVELNENEWVDAIIKETLSLNHRMNNSDMIIQKGYDKKMIIESIKTSFQN